MEKYAFILNTNGGHPDTYNELFVAGNEENYIFGVTGTDEGVEFAKTLKEKGYILIDLCGDFDEEMAAEIASTGIEVFNSTYLPEEMDKMEGLSDEDLCEYGIIMLAEAVEYMEKLDREDPACNIYVRFVHDLDAACDAAKDLVESGAKFMELCSWFDKEKTEKVIAAIDGAIPVGSCGEL